ncbi:hypothetical protein P171DRAFT_471902 [Karstenula rhodostoma CBS 690.94]|uniref:Uncharacterized protein n=1 Tax=Karstenula rhodostoma CBS 690.94 TaxID=1392251 RepID=A0A9P4UDP1_9PLEO|nr:hypothetical protein P171DRAFT_471902 [Karstenula rhodostoma CBS 690.94]
MFPAEPTKPNLPATDPRGSEFIPTAPDIRATRILLHHFNLPTELILLILDHARYWTAHTTFRASKLCLLDWNHSLHHSTAVAYLSAPVSLRPTRTGETPKVREVAFRTLSHDQGWTSEPTQDTYRTSSWFEVSVVQGLPLSNVTPYTDVERARVHCVDSGFMRRSGGEVEEQRMHCGEMRRVTREGDEGTPEEGTHAWWVQGNRVAAASGDLEGRECAVENRVRWGCRAAPVWEGNEGAGRGEGFVDCLRDGDWIVLWARAKRRGWENHVYEASIEIRYTIGPSERTEMKAGPY